ncbi:hypothetical protein [Mycoplasmopsis cynos]|uniref:hypothetical protein n=1 Tax=Mycoplasmopsis cynos TaxID=171284 RepID=UPI00220E5B12|nr:hypothetical protein [Mycoplasmopsis cynos]UWV77381.1 hypothetical protein NW070_00030 [Mycoplasmopsis cynos]
MKKRERSFILIAENINENARTLSIKTGLCVSSIKRYKKIIRSREKIQISHKNKFTKKASHISDSLIENIYKDYISKCKEILNIQLTNNQLSIKEFYYSYLSDELKSLMTYKTLIQRFNQLGLYTIHTTRRGKKIARESRKKFLMR